MTSSTTPTPAGVQLRGELAPAFPEIVSPEALAFVAKLQRAFGNRREEYLQRRHDQFHQPGGKGLPTKGENCGATGPSARLASAGEAHARRWQAGFGIIVRFRFVFFSQCNGADGTRQRPLFLFAEDGKLFGGASLERRVQNGAGRTRDTARDDSRNGPDRNDPSGVRDG